MIERRELAPVRPAQDVLVLPRRWWGGGPPGKAGGFPGDLGAPVGWFRLAEPDGGVDGGRRHLQSPGAFHSWQTHTPGRRKAPPGPAEDQTRDRFTQTRSWKPSWRWLKAGSPPRARSPKAASGATNAPVAPGERGRKQQLPQTAKPSEPQTQPAGHLHQTSFYPQCICSCRTAPPNNVHSGPHLFTIPVHRGSSDPGDPLQG